MTTTQHKLFAEGRGLWQEYVNVNGYSFHPNEEGLGKLAKLLDLNKAYIKERINVFLEA